MATMFDQNFEIVSPVFRMDVRASAGAGTTTPDLSLGCVLEQTCTAATRTIANPAAGFPKAIGQRFFVRIKNTSGGALTLTWGSEYKVVNTAPATANQRIYEFIWDGTNWVQIGATADVAN